MIIIGSMVIVAGTQLVSNRPKGTAAHQADNSLRVRDAL